jgi:hypothetical protein
LPCWVGECIQRRWIKAAHTLEQYRVAIWSWRVFLVADLKLFDKSEYYGGSGIKNNIELQQSAKV